MRSGLYELQKISGDVKTADFFDFWARGSKKANSCSGKIYCVGQDWHCRGIRIGSDEKAPFAYKNVIEGALYRFFKYWLLTCPLPLHDIQPNLKSRRRAPDVCAREMAKDGTTAELVLLGLKVLVETHSYRSGVIVDQAHTFQSCSDVRIDSLIERVSDFIVAYLPDAGEGAGHVRALKSVRWHLCHYLGMVRWSKKLYETAPDGQIVEDDG